ncbi:MAG: excinuclease ABC subunit UvrA [Deltaproteobacteria bacterium]|nr:excinuclease ABC subunit UvrA [Deltaproteobacteria bacterium]
MSCQPALGNDHAAFDRWVIVRGARQHNLKNVDIRFPRDRLVVITGPSGSGKSSLAFDTIFAEGQRRYVESLNVHARQYIKQLPKPDVDIIEGLSPAISVHQQQLIRNPRSTVGTTTEIYDFLRLLYAKIGRPFCYKCGRAISAYSVQQMVDRILDLAPNTAFTIRAPVVRGLVGGFENEIERLRKSGFARVVIDGLPLDLQDKIVLNKAKSHTIDVLVDRLSVKEEIRQRLNESIELAIGLANGLVRVVPVGIEEFVLSEKLTCIACGVSLPPITPGSFSFNSPTGACEECGGLGETVSFDPDRIIPIPERSIREGAVAAWGKVDGAYYRSMMDKLADALDVDLGVPWKHLSRSIRERILYGTELGGAIQKKRDGQADSFHGIIPGLERRLREYQRRNLADQGTFDFIEEELDRFSVRSICRKCGGSRLNQQALSVKLGGKNIWDLTSLSLEESALFLQKLPLSEREREIGAPILSEISQRLGFLLDLGLDYLCLDRSMSTLSTGEAERIRLANQIGSSLVGVLYVLDEPSIGLHARDNKRLLETLLALRDRGNTVLMVEHDTDAILAADYVIDMGPAAGRDGGRLVVQGTPNEIMKHPESITGQYLSHARGIRLKDNRRPMTRRAIVVEDATSHNLACITARFPLGLLICVTGVSGSGKSSLVMDTLLRAARQRQYRACGDPVRARVSGLDLVDKVVHIDQAPIGRTPRSNPATYTGVFAPIRELYAGLKESRARGYNAARFSFNNKGGRCEECRGDGILRVEMHFLPDVYIRCKACKGQRYNRATLEIRYRGKNVAEILSLTIQEAYEFLAVFPKIREQLSSLRRVGLGYLELGQSATTLSGGEAQRLKLSRELARRSTGRTLYILDEPTTGLHLCDIEVLMDVLSELVDAGNTVVVVEHNLQVIKLADYVIDLGPEGGARGGRIVATGTPEEIAATPDSFTGNYLRKVLNP